MQGESTGSFSDKAINFGGWQNTFGGVTNIGACKRKRKRSLLFLVTGATPLSHG